MPTIRIEGDDDAYIAWVSDNPRGWVVNARSAPDREYLKLHRASCVHISRPDVEPGAWTERDYIKICAQDRTELERWLVDRFGTRADAGCYCVQSR